MADDHVWIAFGFLALIGLIGFLSFMVYMSRVSPPPSSQVYVSREEVEKVKRTWRAK